MAAFRPMDALGLIATAAGLSLLAGWRVYLCVFAAGLAMRFGIVPLPDHLQGLAVLANPWVLGVAATGALAEFFADKVAWVDSLWDAVHTAIRPVGGALLAMAVVDPADPAWQVISLLLGGGAALASHAAKAGARATVNASPEPFSNVIVSTGEDVASIGLLAAIFASPVLAAIVALVLVTAAIGLMIIVRRLLGRLLPVSGPG